MAKKLKLSDKAVTPVLDTHYSPALYIEFDDLKELQGLSLGDKITVVVAGTVKSLTQRDNGDRKYSEVCLEDFEAEIAPKDSVFADLVKDENDS